MREDRLIFELAVVLPELAAGHAAPEHGFTLRASGSW